MNKFLYTIFISAFAVFFVACAKVDEKAVSFTSETGLAITGSIMNFDDTKVAYFLETGETGNVLKSSWVEGDRIFGFDNTGATFTFEVESIEDSKAKFRIVVPPASDAEKLFAIYYPGKTSFDLEKVDDYFELSVDVSSQSGKLEGNTPAIMCATGEIKDNTVEFKFSNQMAIVGIYKMQIRTDETQPVEAGVEINGVTLNNVATTGTIKIDDKGFGLKADTELHAISATGLALETKAEGIIEVSAQNALSPYFAVIPTQSAPISVTATDGTITYHNLTEIDATSLDAGLYYYLGKKLDKIVAICDGQGYTDLEEAFKYAAEVPKDVTIKMYGNVVLPSTIEFANTNGKITLDLNGFDIDASAVSIAFSGATSFEVKDDNELSKQGIVTAKTCAIHLKPESNSQTLTIKGGKFKASGYSTGGTGVIFFQNNSQTYCRLYVQGGEVTSTDEQGRGRAVNVNCSSTLSGGKIESKGIGWRCYGGTTTIDGTAEVITNGTNSPVVGNGSKTFVSFENGYAKAADGVSIISSEKEATVTVTGGHFNKEVTSDDGLKEGYICYKKGEPSGYEYIVESEAGEALFEYTEGGQTYKTNAKLVDAITMANEYKGECTITMLKNYTLVSKQTITNSKGVTLDLNGWTITHDGTKRIGVSGSGNLIITDNKGGGIITQTAKGSSTITYSSGNLTIAGGTIKKEDGSTYNTINISGGTLTVTGGEITNNSSGYATIAVTSDSEKETSGMATVSGGMVTSSAYRAISVSGTGQLTVSGSGKVKSTASTAVTVSGSGQVTMTGGEIKAETATAGSIGISISGNSSQVTISGEAKVTSTISNGISAPEGTLTITGGYFAGQGTGTFGKAAVYRKPDANSTVKISGGYYSKDLDENLLKKDDPNYVYKCINNTDVETMADYPFIVKQFPAVAYPY